MKGNRLAGAALGAVLAISAGGVAVGLASHPVGDRSASVTAWARTDRLEYAHVDGGRRSSIDASLWSYRHRGAYSGTSVGGNGYVSRGGPSTYDELYAYVRICDDSCVRVGGELRNATRSQDARSGTVQYSGTIRGHRVTFSLETDGPPAVAESGYRTIEPGYPAVYLSEGATTYRTGTITGVWFDDVYVDTRSIAHNHADLLSSLGGGIQARAFLAARRG